MKTKERDVYLDFYRGIAVISVIFIHTVFWSGTHYLRNSIFRTFALMVDVPLFVFLSGWSAFYTSSIKKTFLNLIKIWAQYGLFILLIDIVCNVFWYPGTFSVENFLNQLAFAGSTTEMPVIAGSLWFMPMWIPVALVGSILTVFVNHCLEKYSSQLYAYIILFLLIGVFYLSVTNRSNWFLLNRLFCFYMIFYLLGYLAANHHFGGKFTHYIGICITLLFLWFTISRLFQIPAKDLQSAKALPHLMYLVASMFSIVTVVYFRGKINAIVKHCSIVGFIGKNALVFYFTQGIGSSLIDYIWPHIIIYGPYLTLFVCFAINLAITLGTGIILARIYYGTFRMIAFIKRLVLEKWKIEKQI